MGRGGLGLFARVVRVGRLLIKGLLFCRIKMVYGQTLAAATAAAAAAKCHLSMRAAVKL